jgi:hypothetical protein
MCFLKAQPAWHASCVPRDSDFTSSVRNGLGGLGEATVVRQNRSWFALVTFCGTTALIAALGLAILIASATVAFALAQSFNVHRNGEVEANSTFDGMITDARCGARHAKDSNKSPAECSRMCARRGEPYELVDGEKRYTLHGNSQMIDRLAGQRVKVFGQLDGQTIQVTSAKPL